MFRDEHATVSEGPHENLWAIPEGDLSGNVLYSVIWSPTFS